MIRSASVNIPSTTLPHKPGDTHPSAGNGGAAYQMSTPVPQGGETRRIGTDRALGLFAQSHPCHMPLRHPHKMPSDRHAGGNI